MNSLLSNFFLDDDDDEFDELLRISKNEFFDLEDNFIYSGIEDCIISHALKRGKDKSAPFQSEDASQHVSSSRKSRKKKSNIPKRSYLKTDKFKLANTPNTENSVENFIDSDIDDEEIQKFLRSRKKRNLGRKLPAGISDHKTRNNELRMHDHFENKSPEEFFKSLRVTKETYKFILEKLESKNLFSKYSYGGNLAVTPRQALQIFLFSMCHRRTYKQLSNMFHISESAIMTSFFKCVEGINSMDDEEVKWPLFEDMETIENDFKDIAGLSGVVGSLGGCCIEMRTGKEPPAGYKIGKLRSIMYLLGVVDAQLKFIYIQAGFPGTFSLQEAFESSSLGEMMKENPLSLFPSDDYHLVSNSELSLQNHLMVPYSTSLPLNPQQKLFNDKVLSTNVCDLSFKYLRGRFTSLQTQIYASLQKIPNIVKACCIIHNLALKDTKDRELLLENLELSAEEYSIYRDDTDFIPAKPDKLSLSKRNKIAQSL